MLPAAVDVRAAAERLRDVAIRTPLVENAILNERAGCRVFVKPECLQRTGSFKFRGAYNKILQIPEDRRAAGVVAYSSGNHAQGVAEAARLIGVPCTIVMPTDAPVTKVARTRRSGAEVVRYDRWSEDREAIALKIAAERGATVVPPYEDRDIIAGQGTVALEIAWQVAAIDDEPLKALLVPCGGGGLTAGCALAMGETNPQARIVIAEPEGFDDTARSLAAGERLPISGDVRSVCDALLSKMPGEMTFAINRRRVSAAVSVSDEEALAAVAFAFHELKLVVEPGGAVALAGVLSGRVDLRGGPVAVVASGGNIDDAMMVRALTPDPGT